MSQPTHDPELNAVERALAALTPSAGTFDRDALMFAAGRRSVRRGWAWPTAAAGSSLAAAVLAAVLLFRPAPAPEVRFIVREVERPPAAAPVPPETPAAPAEESPPSPPIRPGTDYLTLRQQVERWGDAALPTPPPAAEEGPPRADPFDLPPDVQADPWLRRRMTPPQTGGPL
ncbi:MAG TPA: hypothetical protein VFW33_23850 [Gemmataceae bacterium]|nr:hypothetical protein [Gemmataceae bacterium]